MHRNLSTYMVDKGREGSRAYISVTTDQKVESLSTLIAEVLNLK